MLQKHPFGEVFKLHNKNYVPIFQIGNGILSNAEDIEKVAKVLKHTQPRVIVMGGMREVDKTLERIADLFFDDEPQDAWELFEHSFVGYHKKIAEELDLALFANSFLKILKNELKEMVGIDILNSHEQHHREEFKNFILTFGPRAATAILYCHLYNKPGKNRFFSGVTQEDARKYIISASTVKGQKDEIKTQTSVEKLVKLLKGSHRPIVMESFIASENKNLGKEGEDTTLALVALAYRQAKLFPAVTYLKELNFSNQEPVSFEIFSLQQEGVVQPQAIELLATENIPFQVASLNENYCIAGSEEFAFKHEEVLA